MTMRAIVSTMQTFTTPTKPLGCTLRKAVECIAERESFNANGTFTGRVRGHAGHGPIGQLPDGLVTEFISAGDAPDFYCVRSYYTPIAWYADGIWTIPAMRYSATTSKHQALVRKAIS